MKECATCEHYRPIYKGTHPNYAGCDKASVDLSDPYKCTAYKPFSIFKRIKIFFRTLMLNIFDGTPWRKL